MRTKLIATITELAEKNDNLYFLVGDLGYSVVEGFKERFPDRFYNMGVAEQNMMGVAAGLALTGATVFTYSFANFTTFRCLEQIRNDICYHNLNVKIIGIGTGFSYGTLGMTHFGIEDLAVMTALPNMTVITPCDSVETALAVNASAAWCGPCYIRIRRHQEPIIHRNTSPDFTIGKGIIIKEGTDVTLIATGWILNKVIAAAGLLEADHISARVISMHTTKPLDNRIVLDAAKETRGILTVEDHCVMGLGSAVAMVLATSGCSVPFVTLGLMENYSYGVGSEEYHLNKNGLSADAIYRKAKEMVR